jgi:hypothetical protein
VTGVQTCALPIYQQAPPEDEDRKRLALSLGPHEQAPPEDEDRILSPKCSVLNKRAMENAHNCDNYISQSYILGNTRPCSLPHSTLQFFYAYVIWGV